MYTCSDQIQDCGFDNTYLLRLDFVVAGNGRCICLIFFVCLFIWIEIKEGRARALFVLEHSLLSMKCC